MPKIGYSANGFGKAMEASVQAVDADGGVLENHGLRRVPVATVLANGAGEMPLRCCCERKMTFDFCCKNGSG